MQILQRQEKAVNPENESGFLITLIKKKSLNTFHCSRLPEPEHHNGWVMVGLWRTQELCEWFQRPS